MSYYMLGVEFWSAVSLLVGGLPLLAVLGGGLARSVRRVLPPNRAHGAVGSGRGILCPICGASSTR